MQGTMSSRYGGKPVEPGRPVDLGKWHGRFRDGYGEEDVSSVLSQLSAALGVDVVCVWETLDELGCGGGSFFVVYDGETVRRTPPSFDALLLGEEDAPRRITPAEMRTGEPIPGATPEDVRESDAYPHNGVWAEGR